MLPMDECAYKLFIKGKINTLDTTHSYADWMLIEGEKIFAIGKLAELHERKAEWQKLGIEKWEEIDLHQHVIYPGFIDAHLHPITNILSETCLNCSEFTSMHDFIEKFKQFAETKPLDQFAIGIKFNEQNFIQGSSTENIFPTKELLDAIDSSHPLVLYRYDLHILAVNSRTLHLLQCETDLLSLPDGEIGEIRLNEKGYPNGQFTEDAMKLIQRITPIPPLHELLQAKTLFETRLAKFGITSIGAVINQNELAALQQLHYLQDFMQDCAFYFNVPSIAVLNALDTTIKAIDHGFDHLIVNGLKRFVDGSFGAHTALLYRPYHNSEHQSSGMWATIPERLENDIQVAVENHFDVMVHAIGDRANDELVEIYRLVHTKSENISKRHRNRHRDLILRIEHASMLTSSTIETIRDLHIVPVSQPEFIRNEAEWLVHFLGRDRMEITYPYKSILDADIPLAAASDSPVETENVLQGIQDCVLRFGFTPSQRISVEDALHLYTTHAAYAIGESHRLGSLTPGKQADFVILEQDLGEIDPERIPMIQIKATYKRGKQIYPI